MNGPGRGGAAPGAVGATAEGANGAESPHCRHAGDRFPTAEWKAFSHTARVESVPLQDRFGFSWPGR
jgi:hypothetical protein